MLFFFRVKGDPRREAVWAAPGYPGYPESSDRLCQQQKAQEASGPVPPWLDRNRQELGQPDDS